MWSVDVSDYNLVLKSLYYAIDGRPSSSGLRGRRRTNHTILKRASSANFKMVWYVLDPATSDAGAWV
jgi:hypothetical protein